MDYADKQEALVRVFGAVHAYENDTFIVSPDRIGFGILTYPLSWIDQSVVDSWQALINLPFPEGTILQCIMYASPDVEMTLHTFSTLRNNLEDGPIKAAIHERMKFLRLRAEESLGSAAPARLRNVQCVIAVQLPTGGVEPSEQKLNEMRELRQNMGSLLRGMNYPYETMTPQLYVRFMETVMNHGPDAVWRKTAVGEYDERVLLCNQILDGDTPIHIRKDHLEFGEHAFVRVISPKRIPEKMFAGQGFRYLADLAAGTDAMKDPVLITVNVLYPNSDKRTSELTRDNLWTMQQQGGKLARFLPDLGKKKRSLDIAMRDIENGDRPLYAYIGAATIAPTADRSLQASTDLISMFRRLGFQMVEDQYSTMPMFSQLIPFGASEDIKKSLLRYRTLTARTIVPMLPMFGSWHGTGTPLLTFFGRDGQLMSVSPWDTNAGYNAIVAAQTGAGKSFLANFMIENILSVQGRVWVIDKGGSYKNLCEALDGQYIEFEDGVDLSLNPFTQIQNFDDEMDIVAGMIEVMAAPRDGFDDFEVASVKRVLKEAWDDLGNKMTIDDLQKKLLAEDDDRLQDVGKQLYLLSWLSDYVCSKKSSTAIDIAFMSELDPSWNNDALAIWVGPEAKIFSAPWAIVACSADAAMATVRKPLKSLYYCAGSWGMVFPMAGSSANQTGLTTNASLTATRGLAKMHRFGIAERTYGTKYLCANGRRFVLEKQQYRMQMVFPLTEASNGRMSKNKGSSNHWIGASTFRWGGEFSTPPTKEDYIFLQWGFQECCVTLW